MKDTPVVGAIMALCGVVFVLELVAGNLFQEMLRQQGDVFPPFTQWWKVQMNRSNAVKQI